MWKYAIVLTGLLFSFLIAGCGGESSSNTKSTVVFGTNKVAITSDDTSGKTFYITKTANTPTVYTLDSLSNGNLVMTDTGPGGTQHTFTCIQKEDNSSYWLVYDIDTFTISRLYFDFDKAAAYDPRLMGGSIQGTSLALPGSPSKFCVGGIGYTDGSSDTARFNKPAGITYDGTNFYVADYANHVIRQITPAGDVTTFAGNGTHAGTADGIGTAAFFNFPNGITTDGKNLYVADYASHTIRKIEIATRKVTTIAGTAGSAGYVDSVGALSRFSFPLGITTDGTNLYVADTNNSAIRKINLSTTAVTTVTTGITKPTRLTTDGSSLFVISYNEYGNSLILKIVMANRNLSFMNSGIKFGQLGGITTDGTNLYVGDISSDLTKTYIQVINKTTPVSIATITIPASEDGSAGTIPPFGLTTNGTQLYYTSISRNNVSYY